MTNKVSAFYFDNLIYEPLKCISEEMQKLIVGDKIPYDIPRDYEKEHIFYKPPQCSRYHMNYKLKLNLAWVPYNHASLSRGPPIWKIKKKEMDRDTILFQEAKIYSSHAD